MANFEGKRVLVTGASRGAGFGIAKAFAAAGAEVVATARNEQRLEKLRREIEADGGKVVLITGDLNTRAAVRGIASQAGEIDVLVNNAAVTTAKCPGFLEQDDAGWDLQFAVNVVAPVTLMQALVPGMVRRGGGVVINISSIAGQQPNPLHGPYGASKAALDNISKAAAIELGSKGVRVNCIALSLTDTEALEENLAGGMTKEQIGPLFIPIGRVTKVSEVAALCLALADHDIAALTGTVINLDGGCTAGNYSPALADTGLTY